MLPGDLRAEQGAESPVRIAHLHVDGGFLAFSQRLTQLFQQDFFVHCFFQFKIIGVRRIKGHLLRPGIRIIEHGAQIQLPCHGAFRIGLLRQQVGPPDHLIQGADTQTGHVFPQFFRDKPHKVHHIFRFAREAFPKFRVLGGHAHRTGIQVADTHHHTAHGHEGRGGETEFLGAEECGDGHIPAAHQLAVRLDHDPAPKPVSKERLMSLRKAQLPGKARIVDGALRRRAGSAVIAGDQNHLGARFGHACGDSPDAGFRHQLHRDPGIFIGIFQIIDELRQILDGIDVMVRRRRDQAHAGRGMSGLRDPGVYLPCRQMSALSGLRALSHFDLDLGGADQIPAGHTEPAAGHLFDGRAAVVFRSRRIQTVLALAALAGIGFPVEHIHGKGQRLMGLL